MRKTRKVMKEGWWQESAWYAFAALTVAPYWVLHAALSVRKKGGLSFFH